MLHKRRTVLVTGALVIGLAGMVFGQTAMSPLVNDHQKLESILETNLQSNIQGIIEGTIYDMIQYKSYFPERDFSRLVADLNTLSEASPDSEISYKAHLASMFLRYGSSLDTATSFSPDNHEHAFQLASDQLSRKFLFSHATQ